MRRISLLGSTGSIGASTLEVIRKHPDRFELVGLAAGSNAAKLAEQVIRFRPKVVALRHPAAIQDLKERIGRRKVEILAGADGVRTVAALRDAQAVVSAISGSDGLSPTLAAVRAGKTVLLANKESIVMAGELLLAEARKSGAKILPLDSEHNALFQCLDGKPSHHVKRLTITASGGPFLSTPVREFKTISPERALKHPIWKMGKKITIDSATLMNKALELIETRWLFDVRPDRIGVLIHPQSIVHAIVDWVDTSATALMARPDMKIPIAYALAYPDRVPMNLPVLDLAEISTLTFLEPDVSRFPSLAIARSVLQAGNGSQIVMNAANEVAVHAFLARAIPFGRITRTVAGTLDKYPGTRISSLGGVFQVDQWARDTARRLCGIQAVRPNGHGRYVPGADSRDQEGLMKLRGGDHHGREATC